MSVTTKKVYNMYERRQAIPILYVRGTHYDVGYDVVREFTTAIRIPASRDSKTFQMQLNFAFHLR